MKKLVLASAISMVTTSAMAVTSPPVQLIDRYKVARTCEIDLTGTTSDGGAYGDRVFSLEVKTNASSARKKIRFNSFNTQHVNNAKIVQVGEDVDLVGQTIPADSVIKVAFKGEVQATPGIAEGTSLTAQAEVTATCL